MKKDKLRLCALETFLVLFLMITLFSNRLLTSKISVAIFLLLYAIIVRVSVRSSKKISIHSKEVQKYMIVFAALYLVLYYVIGYYVGYYKATYRFGFWTLYTQIIPLIVIIYSSELIRKEFLSNKSKFSFVATFLFGVLVDLVVYTNLYNLTNLPGLLEALGYVFFASIASNLLYNYVCINFDIVPNVLYRIITTIYLYIIPITPDVHMYFKSFARIVYPVIILLVLIDSYDKKHTILTIKNKNFRIAITSLVVILITLFTMLITCRFRYGLIVIGSNSMNDVLYKGDAVVFDSKNKNYIEGEIILFKQDNITVVHRIVRVEESDGKKKIFTKGDNNANEDSGFRTTDDIVGIVELRVKKIGLPTIWLNELLK